MSTQVNIRVISEKMILEGQLHLDYPYPLKAGDHFLFDGAMKPLIAEMIKEVTPVITVEGCYRSVDIENPILILYHELSQWMKYWSEFSFIPRPHRSSEESYAEAKFREALKKRNQTYTDKSYEDMRAELAFRFVEEML